MENKYIFTVDLFRDMVINYLSSKLGFYWYLEIGCADLNTFKKVNCLCKVGVDPAYTSKSGDNWITYQLTSDEFFRIQQAHYDISFIDGLHHCEQVAKDIINTWNVLTTGGIILLHDCIPISEEASRREPVAADVPWNGDCYKAVLWFKNTYPNILCKVLFADNGIGIIYKHNSDTLPMEYSTLDNYLNLDYNWLQNNLDEIEPWNEAEFKRFVEGIRKDKIPAEETNVNYKL